MKKSLVFYFILVSILLFTQVLSVQSQTIGNNAEGTLTDPPTSAMQAQRFQCSQNMTVDLMYVKIATSGTGTIKCAIYSDNSGNPGTFLMGTNQLTNPGTGWKSFDLTSGLALTSGTYYHLVLWTNDTGYQVYYTETGTGVNWRYLTYGTWPGSYGTPTLWSGCTYCIYAAVSTKITAQPQSITRCTGTSATFSVTATGTSLTYQWKKGGSDISGATSSSYTITSVASGDAGDYTVVVSGAYGSPVTSSTATLTVSTPPSITVQPQSITRNIGTSATFSVTATGTSLTYQWKKGGSDISGATSSSYTITSVASSDAGNYTVVVSGACGSPVTSSTAILTVGITLGNTGEGTLTDPPTSAMQAQRFQCSQNMTATKMYVKIATSGTGTIKCAIYSDNSGNPGTFLMGTNQLTNPGTGWKSFDLTSGLALTSGTYYHLVLWTNDTGYQVYYTETGTGVNWRYLTYGTWPGSYGTPTLWSGCTYCIYTEGTISECTNPSITVQPQSITRNIGTSATFSVTATGTSLTYQWKKGGSDISGATSSSYIITSVESGDAGNYTVVVSGACGSPVTSSTAILTVGITLGNTGEGTLTDAPTNAMNVIRYQCSQNMTATKMYAKIATSGTGDIKCAIYADNSGAPGAFLMGTNVLTNPGTGWKSFDLTSGLSLTSGTWYHLALWTNNTGYVINYTATGPGTPWRQPTPSWGAWPDPFGTTSPWADCTYCIYTEGTISECTNPSITAQPQSITVCADTSATFCVTATGTSLTYQWKKGGTDISGATSSCYTISSVASGDAGNYTVVVSGACGSPVTSSTAILIVSDSPSINAQPQSITRNIGTSATFSVTATGTSLTYQWKKGGSDISGATSSSYTIDSVASGDAGNYTVVVSGACGSPVTSNTATLTIASVYYIDPNGSDTTGNGTSGNPWKSLYKACNSVSTSGSIIHVNAGTYTETSQSSLSLGVSIEGEGQSTSIINCRYTNGDTHNNGAAQLILSSGSIQNGNQHISNIRFDGNYPTISNIFMAIKVTFRSNVEIYNVTVSNFLNSGIEVIGYNGCDVGVPPAFPTGNSIHNCIFNNCSVYWWDPAHPNDKNYGDGRACIRMDSQDSMLIYNNNFDITQRTYYYTGYQIKGVCGYNKNCKIYNNTMTRTPNDAANYLDKPFDFAIELWNGRGGNEIYNNTIVGGGIDISGGADNIKGSSTFSTWIHHNSIGNTTSPSGYTTLGICVETNQEYVVIEKNYIYNVKSGIYFPHYADGEPYCNLNNTTVRYNILKNIERYGIMVALGSDANETISNLAIYNNVIIGTGISGNLYGISIVNNPLSLSASGILIRNNIIQDFYSYCVRLPYITASYIQNNIFYSNGYDSPYYSGSATVSGNLTTQPPFVSGSDFHLTADRPGLLIADGAFLSSNTSDYESTALDNPPTIGAYEYNDSKSAHVITGIDNLSKDESFMVYPNPVKDNLTITFKETDKPVSIKLYDSKGTKLYEEIVSGSTILNMSSYASGMYILNISLAAGELKAVKIIKNDL